MYLLTYLQFASVHSGTDVKGYCGFSYATKPKKWIFRACSVQRRGKDTVKCDDCHIWQHRTCLELTTMNSAIWGSTIHHCLHSVVRCRTLGLVDTVELNEFQAVLQLIIFNILIEKSAW